MEIGEILLLATVALVLLGGLVSLGIGHRRWSIGTVVAGFLVLLAAATYLYFAARLASRDQAWARKIDDYKARLAKAEDGDGGPAGGGGPLSLVQLREQRDRWQRGRDRVDTWRGRVWQGASFQPPRDDASTGRIELAPEAKGEDNPPIGEGAHVFLFDATPYEEGGAYLGAFLVQATGYDEAAKRQVLTVVQTAPRDAYDAKVLARPHDPVIVFEDLPVDRWLAFYRSRAPDGDEATGAALPEAVKEDAEKVHELLATAPEVGELVRQFADTFARHEEDVPEDEWDAAAAEAADNPGTLWADVEFTKTHRFGSGAEAGAEAEAGDEVAAEDAEGPKRDFEEGDRAEFDLQTALDLRDQHGAVTIERVFRRRPLADALTLLHGARAAVKDGPADGIDADGVATLRRLLQTEVATLERSNERLKAAMTAAAENTDDQQRVARELEQDLGSWRRDAHAAAELAAGFEKELGRTTRALEAAEGAIVEQGRELTAALTLLAREIDEVAPPPQRRAARP